jgi:putative glycosyltransferase (TIGR04348 family)
VGLPVKSHSKSIRIVCPAKPGTRRGNRVTALRWQTIFRNLGHRPRIVNHLDGDYDILVALHAFRSADAVALSKKTHPGRPIVVAITGTDLYRDIARAATQNSLMLADRIVVLQPSAIDDLPEQFRDKTRVIYQSVQRLKTARPRCPLIRQVIVAGHIRSVKDPFRAAMAVRQLPSESKIQVCHYGNAMTASMKQTAETESKKNERYHWYGDIPRGELRRRVARCWMMVLSSKMEGGANVLSEAIVNHTPLLASRISGSIGLLGVDYEGYFDVGNTGQLRELLLQCERDPSFYNRLQKQVAKRAPLFLPADERRAWKDLLTELC